VTGIAVSSDGASLYVGQEEAIVVTDRDSGAMESQVPVPGIISIERVLK
jgi:hypothetical protein